jgi:hypothetical protein
MYCSRCHRQLCYQDLECNGWCDDCGKVVRVSQCKVSYWVIGVVCIMTLAVQMGL